MIELIPLEDYSVSVSVLELVRDYYFYYSFNALPVRHFPFRD
jgi:hypothetical protein